MSASAPSFERLRAREAVRAQLFGTTPLLRLGRYELRGVLGRGGLGVVHRAYDPLLGRDVALKVLHGEQGGSSGARAHLVAEARSLARVASPDIVPVFDVGQSNGHLFLAMELVVGQDLRKWLTARKRSVDEVIAVFLGAARGLEAVHAAGLVHRDFKPENVLLGADGRARVADFGLARIAEALPSAHDDGGSDGSRSGAFGAVLAGTPAYMAPELFAGEPASVARDVHAFAASLFEGLYGRRPYTGTSLPALLAAAERGAIDRAALVGVSPRVRDVVLRGLSPRPTDRWPDVGSFARALVGASRPRRWWIARRVGLPLVALGALAAVLARPSPVAPCATALARFDDAVRDSDLAGVDARVSRRLDEIADAWRHAHAEVCRAPDARSTEVRLACLADVGRGLEATRRVLATHDAHDVGGALDAIDALDDPHGCVARGDEAAVLVSAELADAIATARAQVEIGDYAGGLATAEAALADVDATRDRAALPDLLWIRGVARLNHGDGDRAMEDLEAAFHLAVATQDADVAASTADALAFDHAHRRHDTVTGTQWLRTAESWVTRGATSVGASELAVTRAAIAESDNDPATAIAGLEAALAAETCTVCAARFALLEALVALAPRERVMQYAEAAVAVQTSRYGEHSVAALEAAVVLASAQRLAGRPEDAIATATAATERAAAMAAFDPLRLASLYDTIGSAYADTGRVDLATPWLERAVAAVTVPGVSESRYVVSLRYNLARTYQLQDDPRAIDQLHAVVAALEADGGESADLAVVLSTLAVAESADHRDAAALASIRRASSIVAMRPNTDAIKDITILARHGELASAVDPAEARAAYERALGLVPAGPEHDRTRDAVAAGLARACAALPEGACDDGPAIAMRPDAG